ncbi:MAG: hypothetical protein V7K47_16855 [Nostoc sp.]
MGGKGGVAGWGTNAGVGGKGGVAGWGRNLAPSLPTLPHLLIFSPSLSTLPTLPVCPVPQSV